MTPTKLKTTGVKKTRTLMHEQQGGFCAICNLVCTPEEAVLDHCHKGGHVRAVLHRSCNSLLGKVENGAPRYGMKPAQLIAFLHGAGNYLSTHAANQTALIHPTHFTPEEKAERRKLKTKRARVKAKAAKAST